MKITTYLDNRLLAKAMRAIKANSQREAIEVTERINRHLAERFSIRSQNLLEHASAGIATGRRGQMTPEELIRNADLAMYRAKAHGHGRYEVFD